MQSNLGKAVRTAKRCTNEAPASDLLEPVPVLAELAELAEQQDTPVADSDEPSVWRHFDTGRKAGAKVTSWLVTAVIAAVLLAVGFVDGLAFSTVGLVAIGLLWTAAYAAGFAVGYVGETFAGCRRRFAKREKHPAE